jgi:hypothetical protein
VAARGSDGRPRCSRQTIRLGARAMTGWRASCLVHLLLTFSIAACARPPMIITNVEVFHDLPTDFAGKRVAIASADPIEVGSLEFRTYADKLAERLTKVGFDVVAPDTESPPDYVAALAYGVGAQGLAAASASGWIMADYAGGGYYRGLTTVGGRYPRALVIGIAAVPQKADEQPRQVYQMTAVSTGSCRALGAVIDPMLDAVFRDFPGESATLRTYRVPSPAALSWPNCGHFGSK